MSSRGRRRHEMPSSEVPTLVPVSVEDDDEEDDNHENKFDSSSLRHGCSSDSNMDKNVNSASTCTRTNSTCSTESAWRTARTEKPVYKYVGTSGWLVHGVRLVLKSYTQYMAVAGNPDKGLKFLQYTLWFASHICRSASTVPSRRPIGTFANVSLFFSKLSSHLSLTRCGLRLLEFPVALEALVHNSWMVQSRTLSSSHFAGWDNILGRLLAMSMCLYYPMEHIALFHSVVATRRLPNSEKLRPPQEWWSMWSCRRWLAFTVLELFQCALQCHELRQEQKRALSIQSNKPEDVSPSSDVNIDQNHKAQRHLQLQVLRNILCTLPALHRSLPHCDTKPWLPPTSVQFLLWLESLVCVYQSTFAFCTTHKNKTD